MTNSTLFSIERNSSLTNSSRKFEFDFIPENKKKITTEYLITSEILGRGAFGVVRKCIHLITNQPRAIKMIFKGKCNKPQNKKIFNEINILKNLNHPNIVTIYEYFQDDVYIYIVMELVQGVELLEKIMEEHHMSEKISASIMEKILSTVNYLHSQKIVHRDIKPENILYDGENIKLIDFGTARKFNTTKRMKKIKGTSYYIAPEIIKGAYTEKCDIWSCGVIMYLLLTGVPPFGGKSDKEIFKNILQGKLSLNLPEFASVSEIGKSLLQKLLNLNYKDRISVSEALQHPWFEFITKRNSISHDKQIFENLKSFYVCNQFQKAIYFFVINNLASNSEKNDLIKTFKNLDSNKDGVLSLDEIKVGLDSVGIMLSPAELQEIMHKVGDAKTQSINYIEFVAATVDRKKLLNEKRILHCFRLFDKDRKGKIGIGNFKDILQSRSEMKDDQWRAIIQEFDVNGDGEIEFFEFKEILMKLTEK